MPAAGRGGFEQQTDERIYEEVLVCRGGQRLVKGSEARRRMQHQQQQQENEQQHRHGRHGGGGEGGGTKWFGLLEGPSTGLWTCDGVIDGGGGGNGGARGSNILDLAVNPSP